jgi:hypothetical protein
LLRRNPHRLERRLAARDGDVVLACAVAPTAVDLPEVVRIEGTALVVWDALDAAESTEALVTALSARFGVPAATVAADVEPLLAGWREAGIVTGPNDERNEVG